MSKDRISQVIMIFLIIIISGVVCYTIVRIVNKERIKNVEIYTDEGKSLYYDYYERYPIFYIMLVHIDNQRLLE